MYEWNYACVDAKRVHRKILFEIIVCVLTPINLTTVRNFEIVFDKFKVVGMC